MPPTYYPIPDDIADDGHTDVTEDIMNWLGTIPDGDGPDDVSVAVFGDHKTYGFDGKFTCHTCEGTGQVDDKPCPTCKGSRYEFTVPTLIGRKWILLAGRNSDLLRTYHGGERSHAHLRFNHCDNLNVNRLHVKGSAPDAVGYDGIREAQHAFHVLSCVGMIFKECAADDVWGDKVYVGSSQPGDRWSENIEFLGFKGGMSHRHSVAITAGRNISMSDCDWGKSARTGIDLEPNGHQGGAIGISADRCRWSYHRLNWLAAAGQRGGEVSNVRMRNCHSVGGSPLSVVVGGVGRRADFTVSLCTTDTTAGNNAGAAMQFHKVEGSVTVTNNVQPLQDGRVTGLPMRVARFYDTPPETKVTYSGNTQDLG